MVKDKRQTGRCVFCGAVGPLYDDHVPPKNLFPHPRPSNLITVPGCFSCNSGASDHDEYFRLMLAMREDLAANQPLVELRPKALRALDKPSKTGLRLAIEAATKTVSLYSPRGELLVHEQTIEVNIDRLNFVASKTTIGLYFKFFGLLTGEEVKVGSQIESKINFNATPELMNLRQVLLQQEALVSYPHVFEARVVADGKDPRLTIWRHTFYDKVVFISTTTPQKVWDAGMAEGSLTSA